MCMRIGRQRIHLDVSTSARVMMIVLLNCNEIVTTPT